MTLTKAIEAAREAMEYFVECHADAKENGDFLMAVEVDKAHNAIAMLPDKPMTEEEMDTFIFQHSMLSIRGATALRKQLKAANVLYVEEK